MIARDRLTGRLRVLLARVLPFVWMALIYVFSSQITARVAADPLVDVAVKKLGHFVLFAVLAALLMLAVLTTRWSRWAVPVAFVGSLVFAVSDEFHQFFTPSRTPALLDVAIDAAGVVTGLLALEYLRRSRRFRNR